MVTQDVVGSVDIHAAEEQARQLRAELQRFKREKQREIEALESLINAARLTQSAAKKSPPTPKER